MNHSHDIPIRKGLMNLEEGASIINYILKLKEEHKLIASDIELADNRFVTKGYQDKETDIIYKYKEKPIYFLIEHQSKVDKLMAERIVTYKNEIVRKHIQNSNNKNEIPQVIAMVIYTGRGKWKASTNINDITIKDEGYSNIQRFEEYKVLDVNAENIDELLNVEGAIPKILLLDSARGQEDIAKLYEKIEKCKLTNKQKETIKEYTYNILKESLGEEKYQKIIKKYDGKEETEMLVETIKREIRNARRDGEERGRRIGEASGEARGEKRGIKIGEVNGKIIGLKTVAIEMLKQGVDIELIKNWTKLTDKDIEELKASINK